MEYITVSLAPALLPDVMSFLYLYEHTCVNLLDNLLQKGSPVVPDSSDCRVFFVDSGTATEIVGVVMLLKSGLFLHCIPFDTPIRKTQEYRQFLEAELTKMLRNRQLFCIMGEADASGIISSMYEKSASQLSFSTIPIITREYEMRVYDPVFDSVDKEKVVLLKDGYNEDKAKEIRDAGGLPVVQCTVRDINALMPLQKAYEIVEVLPPGQEYSERISRLNLVRAISRYPVYGIPTEDGFDRDGFLKFAAKAGINACGRKVVQIGGVFTEPKYRCRGYAKSLVSLIAKIYSEERKRVVLFVDKRNIAAQRAYDVAGFATASSYRIIYY